MTRTHSTDYYQLQNLLYGVYSIFDPHHAIKHALPQQIEPTYVEANFSSTRKPRHEL